MPGTGYYYDPYYGYIPYTANQVIDHYHLQRSRGKRWRGPYLEVFKFSNQKFYVEGRYVVVFNQHYNGGVTAANVGTSYGLNYTGYNYYPANSDRTTYIPITFGLRF